MKKKIKVHKRNEVVRGSDIYSLNAKKAMNAIYYGMQKHRELGTYKHDVVTIQFTTLRKLMSLEKDGAYVTVMKEALTELMQPIHLHNYFHPIDEIEYSWYATTFLVDAGFHKRDNGDWVTQIRVSPLMKHVMQLENDRGQGFTELELIPYMNKFRTKYAMKIYEYLKSFGAYSYINITQKHMMKLLALDEKSRYQYYSKLFELVERQTKEIAKKSDLQQVKLLKSKALAKDKTFRIIINPKSKKEADKTAAKTALENLVKRF
jgi:hypothetical protein